MKAIKILSVFLSLTFACGLLYLTGCTSAESTTGKLAFSQKDYQKAETELKKGLLIDKNDAEGWYMLGYSQIENGHFDDAKESFVNAKKLSSEFGDKILSYWIEKYNAGAKNFSDAAKTNDAAGYKNALRYFQAAVNIIPDSTKGAEALGRTYFALGEKDKALMIFQDVISRTNSPDAAIRIASMLFDEGNTLLTLKKNDDAASTFLKILGIPSLPKNDQYYEVSSYNYGLAKVKAAEELKAANENNPKIKEYYMDALKVVEPLSQTSISNKDIKPRVWDLLVVLYGNTGQSDKAADAYKKAEEIKKENK
ncbi:MAG: tetratricopeptide repeat protein [Ignavibacteria bacterium]|nr:tetratricopeptide repeat protein [Ignavibacteria bacterium]